MGQNTPPFSKIQNGGSGSFAGSGDSAKNLIDLDDAIVPHNIHMEGISDIPMFRVVTKSQTAVQKEDDSSKKFIADGKTQKLREEENYGTKGKSSNPLARGKGLVRQNNIMIDDDDDDDDMDFDEDMFEPRNASGNLPSFNVSPVGDYSTQGSSSGDRQPTSSTPVKRTAPKPSPRRMTPWQPNQKNQESSNSNLSFEDNFATPVTQPKANPRTQSLQKKQAPPPPVTTQVTKNSGSTVVETGMVSTSTGEVVPDGQQKTSQGMSLEATLRSKSRESFSSNSSHSSHYSEVGEFENIVQQPVDEEFKVHVSKLASVDVDMLSLLSEEGVDSASFASQQHSRSSSIASKMTDSSEQSESSKVENSHKMKKSSDLKSSGSKNTNNDSSTHSSHNSSRASSPVPPPAAAPAPTTASSYRAGYLAMMSELRSWDNSESLNKVGLESSDSDRSRQDSLEKNANKMLSKENYEGSVDLPSVTTPEGNGQPSSASLAITGSALRGPTSRPRLASNSSLCSDTGLHDNGFSGGPLSIE